MRTTLNIAAQLFDQIMVLTAASSKTEAVRRALTDYIRLRRKERLLAMRGTMDLSDDWRALRELELTEVNDER